MVVFVPFATQITDLLGCRENVRQGNSRASFSTVGMEDICERNEKMCLLESGPCEQ